MGLRLSTVNSALSSESVLQVRFTILSAELLQDIFLHRLERTVLDLSFPCPSVCGGSCDVSQFHHVNASQPQGHHPDHLLRLHLQFEKWPNWKGTNLYCNIKALRCDEIASDSSRRDICASLERGFLRCKQPILL